MKHPILKRVLAAITMSCITMMAVTGCGSSKNNANTGSGQSVSTEDFEPITLKFSTMSSTEHFSTDSAYAIAEAITKGTGGKVQVEVYPGGQLGDYETVLDEVMSGTIDMAFQSSNDKYNPICAASILPYMCLDYDDLPVLYARDGYLCKQFDKAYQETGVKFLGLFTEGFQGIGSKTDIQNAADPTAQKKKYLLRTAPIKMLTDTFSAQGFSVSTLAYSETLTGLQTGVVDGWVGGTPLVNHESFSDIIKKFYFYKTYVESSHYIMNLDRFNSLPKEYQKVIMDAVAAEQEKSYTLAEKKDNEGLKKLNEDGIETVTFTDEQLKKISNSVRQTVFDKARKTMGDEFINGLNDYLEQSGL